MKKILYLNSFTVKNADFTSSDAIGYGITSSSALFDALQRDFQMIAVPALAASFPSLSDRGAALSWNLSSYQEVLQYLKLTPPDAIFIFHSFQQFPQEIKKMLYHLKLSIPIIGYTHGSHWDPTDTFRTIHTPDLYLSDLANFYCLDALLFVTHTFKKTVLAEIAKFHASTAEQIAAKSHVVGLPIHTDLIDSFYCKKPQDGPIKIVFNHAPVPSKNVGTFLTVMEKILAEFSHVHCTITRPSPPGSPEEQAYQQLGYQYPGRITIGQTLPLAEYYRLLWQADIQVSTATHESLGIATLEAMYTENCCILPNLGAYAEISQSTTEHLYTDKIALLQHLRYYIQNPAARQKIAQKLKQAAIKYSMENLYPQLRDTVQKACHAR